MKLKNVDRRLLTIVLIVFVQMVGAAMILPILPLYAQRKFDMPPQTIALLMTVFYVAQFVAGPFLGRLSDRYGRIPILLVSQVGTVISFAMLGLAQSVAMLFFARILDGITGGNIIVAQAYITDITPREKRAQSLGYVFAVFGLGFIIGPALGGILSAWLGPQIPFLIAALAATLVTLLTWLSLNESLTPEQREVNRNFKKAGLNLKDMGGNLNLMLILFVAFGGQFIMGLLQSTFALFGEAVLFTQYSESATDLGIGLLLAVIGMAQVVTQMFVLKPALKHFGEAKLVIIGSILRVFSMFILVVIISPWIASISMIFLAVGVGIMMPSLQSMATKSVADELRGGVLGWYQSSISLSIIVGTALGGILFAITPTTPYWVGAFTSFIVILPAIILMRQMGIQEAVSTSV